MTKNIKVRWNHKHPPKQPSKFEVWCGDDLVHSGTYAEGMRVYRELLRGVTEMMPGGGSLEVDSSPRGSLSSESCTLHVASDMPPEQIGRDGGTRTLGDLDPNQAP